MLKGSRKVYVIVLDDPEIAIESLLAEIMEAGGLEPGQVAFTISNDSRLHGEGERDREAQTKPRLKLLQILTKRQCEVLRLTVQGLSNREIGAALGIAPGVVAGYLSEIYQALERIEREGNGSSGVANRARLIHFFGDFFDQMGR